MGDVCWDVWGWGEWVEDGGGDGEEGCCQVGNLGDYRIGEEIEECRKR